MDASHHTIFHGTTIDNKLNWVKHIDKVKNKISTADGIKNPLKYVLPREAEPLIVNNSLFHLSYSLL